MATELRRNEAHPGEICEACGRQPAEHVLFRNVSLQTDAAGRVVARVETRVAVCVTCWREITDQRRGFPPARITSRLNRATGKMERVHEGT